MGHNDHEEHDDYKDFLQDLVNGNELDGAALGITKQVIDRGQESLSERQEAVFEAEVVKKYPQQDCKRCGTEIPWSEMYYSYDNGGHCSYCQHQINKND